MTMVLPDITNFSVMPDTYIMGKKVKHYRYITVDSGMDWPEESQNYGFGYTRNDQEDFYCEQEEDMCNPVRWEIHGMDNFNPLSTGDYYVLDINVFERIPTEEQTLAVNMTCTNTPISANKWSNVLRRHASPAGRPAKPMSHTSVKIEGRSFQTKPNKFSGVDAKEFLATHANLRKGKPANGRAHKTFKENKLSTL